MGPDEAIPEGVFYARHLGLREDVTLLMPGQLTPHTVSVPCTVYRVPCTVYRVPQPVLKIIIWLVPVEHGRGKLPSQAKVRTQLPAGVGARWCNTWRVKYDRLMSL